MEICVMKVVIKQVYGALQEKLNCYIHGLRDFIICNLCRCSAFGSVT